MNQHEDANRPESPRHLSGCLWIVAGVLLFIALFLFFVSWIAFGSFEGHDEFTDLSGAAAERRLGRLPSSLTSSEVERVSYQQDFARDSWSAWYRIQLTPAGAAAWKKAERHHAPITSWDSTFSNGDFYEGVEAVHRVIAGPLPLHWQTGETPAWWTPPAVEFEATQHMIWYKNFDSGVGGATYTGLDPETGVLWCYDYTSQHDILWHHGDPPAGEVFSTLKARDE